MSGIIIIILLLLICFTFLYYKDNFNVTLSNKLNALIYPESNIGKLGSELLPFDHHFILYDIHLDNNYSNLLNFVLHVSNKLKLPHIYILLGLELTQVEHNVNFKSKSLIIMHKSDNVNGNNNINVIQEKLNYKQLMYIKNNINNTKYYINNKLIDDNIKPTFYGNAHIDFQNSFLIIRLTLHLNIMPINYDLYKLNIENLFYMNTEPIDNNYILYNLPVNKVFRNVVDEKQKLILYTISPNFSGKTINTKYNSDNINLYDHGQKDPVQFCKDIINNFLGDKYPSYIFEYTSKKIVFGISFTYYVPLSLDKEYLQYSLLIS